MKKIMSLLLALILTAAPLTVTAGAAPHKKKLIICKATELEALAEKCSYDNYSKELFVELGDDIDLSGLDFLGIPYFCGTFDGCGHTVKHYNYTIEGSNVGLFRYTSKNAKIKNLNVEGNIKPEDSSAIVGGIVGENSGIISDCTFSGNVQAEQSAGGIVGKNIGVISGCSFSGSVSAEHRAGGIAGENSAAISDCTNFGSVNTTLISVSDKKNQISFNFDVSELSEDNFLDITDIGGIAGWSKGIISDCTNGGNIGYDRMGYNVGGIAGRQNGRVYGCINKGTVFGRKDVGGIVGQAEPYAVWDLSQTSLNEVKNSLSDIQKKLESFNSSVKNSSPQVKAAAKNLGEYVNKTANDTAVAIGQISGNINQVENAANNTISLISKAIDDHDSKTASKLIDDLSDIAKESADGINTSELTDLLKKLRSQNNDHDLTLTVITNLDSIRERISTFDEAKSDIEKHRSLSKRTTKELIGEIEGAVDSSDIKHAKELADELISLLDSGENLIDTESIDRILHKLRNMENNYLSDANSLYESVENVLLSVSFEKPDINKLTTDVNNIVSTAGKLRGLLINKPEAIKSEAKELINACSSLGDLFISSDKDTIELQTEYQTDVSSLDDEKNTMGVILSCKNNGEISGETNVGGVAGNAACEVDMDVEDKIKLPAYLLQNARYTVFSVISSCTNGNDISAKKQCSGGIVGNADFGIVVGCESSGSIHGGNSCGGIAGMSNGTISNSYSRCLLYGEKNIGGIAGEGLNISGCRSYSYINSKKEYCGSIVGKANGNIKDCYFVDNDLGGIDGISYSGMAEPLSYNDMITLPDIPDWFKTITVTFIANGKTVEVKEVPFGGSIHDLPTVQMDGTRYWKWNDFQKDKIYYSQTVEGEYKDPTTTISTNEDIPLFLAEGTFYEGQKLSVINETPDQPVENEKGELVGAYKISVNSNDSTLHIRMRMPDSGSLYMLSDGRWDKIDFVKDGSYIVFDAINGGTVEFFKNNRRSSFSSAVVWGTSAIVVLIGFLIFKNRKKHKTIKTNNTIQGESVSPP